MLGDAELGAMSECTEGKSLKFFLCGFSSTLQNTRKKHFNK